MILWILYYWCAYLLMYVNLSSVHSPVQIYGISLSNNYAFVPKNQRAALIYINLPSETVMYRSYGIIISDAFVPKNQFINGALV